MTLRDQQDFDPIYREQLSRLRALVQEGQESLDADGGKELDLDLLIDRVRRRVSRRDGRESLP